MTNPEGIERLKNAINDVPIGLLERVIKKIEETDQLPEEGIIEALNLWLDKD